MKKITSFLLLMLVCCISAFAQEVQTVDTQLPTGKMIKVGVAQAKMVPNKWYLLYQHRGGDGTWYEPGQAFTSGGGFAYSQGYEMDEEEEDITTKELLKSTKQVAQNMNVEAGVSASKFMNYLVKFVPTTDKKGKVQEGVYNIQFGDGCWVTADLKTSDEFAKYAGQVGEFNFYLIEENGAENTKGRFGWNKNKLANKVDNNGTGSNILYYASGKNTQMQGNATWMLFDVQIVGNEQTDDGKKPYEPAVNELIAYHNTIVDAAWYKSIASDINPKTYEVGGEVIGNSYGQYSDVEGCVDLFKMVTSVGTMIGELTNKLDPNSQDYTPGYVDPTYDTAEKLEQLLADYKALVKAVQDSKLPVSISDLKSGYYFINSANVWTNKDAEGNDIHPIKAIYSEANGNLRYATLDESNISYLWKIDAVEGKPTEYRLINMRNQLTLVDAGQSSQVTLAKNDTMRVCFDFRGTTANQATNEPTHQVSIRSIKYGENSYNCLHANGWGNGTTVTNNIVGWEGGTGSAASQWYLAPVSEDAANAILNSPSTRLLNMINTANDIIEQGEEQIIIAQDSIFPANIANASRFSSPYHCPNEGSIAGAFDGNPTTYWHGNWASDNDYAYNDQVGTNYFVVNDVDQDIDGGLYVVLTRRHNAKGNHTRRLKVFGSNDSYNAAEDLKTIKAGGEPMGNWTELGELEFPGTPAISEVISSNTINFTGKYSWYKFLVMETCATEENQQTKGFTHFAEFGLHNATDVKTQRYEVSQYQVRKTEADALIEAINNWIATGVTDTDVDALKDPDFMAVYDALIQAWENWSKVYSDPTPLREAIEAAPNPELFVEGNQPGYWPVGTVTPATIIKAAQEYNKSGAYTAEETEQHINAIATSVEEIYSKANKVNENTWYRFSFANEEMYETYGWDKSGSKADSLKIEEIGFEEETSPALWGKYVAVGQLAKDYDSYEIEKDVDGEAIVVEEWCTMYYTELIEDWETKGKIQGNSLMFFSEDEVSTEDLDGEDLFRFIAVNDSAYMIQNKATGLFIRGGYPVYMSAIPSLFQVSAIGAGANAIRIKNVCDKEDVGYDYLHAERFSNRLTSWDVNTLGSNSMMFITAVEEINPSELPTKDYLLKMWPGDYNTMTLPVSVTINDDRATAYGAQVVISESDTTVVLKPLKSKTIEHGTPFVVVTDCDEYVSTEDYWEELEKTALKDYELEELGDDPYVYDEVAADFDEKYMLIEMEHGMEVDTLVHTLLDLRGTMNGESVKTGKSMTVENNKFVHTLNKTTYGAYSAWITTNFKRGMELLNAIQIELSDESIDTGIEEALDKVSKGGNIYTIGGQLVGKGNVNTINKLPAGIYIVNGVKVIKN